MRMLIARKMLRRRMTRTDAAGNADEIRGRRIRMVEMHAADIVPEHCRRTKIGGMCAANRIRESTSTISNNWIDCRRR